jgi:hypothetical protein
MFPSYIFRIASILALATIEAHATTVTLGASKDNTLYQDSLGALSNGSGTTLFAGSTGGGLIRRGLIEFDLSAIPAGSTIDSVTLDLFLTQAQSFPTNVALHEVQAEWGQGTSSGGNRAGGGANATTNDATWLHTFYNTASWANPGGDFASEISATAVVGAEGAIYRWESTPALVADVQGWVNSSAANHGWLLQGDESQSGTAKAFATREDGTAANRPLLTVTFSPVPEPSAFLSVLGGMGMLLIFRRRA